MKKTLKSILLIIIMFITTLGITNVYANGDLNAVQNGMDLEMETKDVYKMEQDVVLSEKINGNMYVMGKDVHITDTVVNGDLFVMGAKVYIEGTTINGNIYALGEGVEVRGVLTKNIYVAGERILIEEDVYVENSIKGAGEQIEFNGKAKYDADFGVEKLTIGSSAAIGRKLEYHSTDEAVIPEQANINKSNVVFHKEEAKKENKYEITSILSEIATTLVLIVAGSALFIFGDKKYKEFIGNSGKWENIWKSFLFGILALIAIPIVAVVLLITGIGVKLSLLAVIVYSLLIALSSTAGIVTISNIIFTPEEQKTENKKFYLQTILIGLAYSILSNIPEIGEYFAFVFIAIGIGSLLRRFFYKEA